MNEDRQTFHLHPEGEKAFGYAQAVRVGKQLHLAGSLSVGPDFVPRHVGDMAGQIKEVYGIIRRTLEAFGAEMADVISERIFVTDMDAFISANAARMAVYEGLDYPACTAVEVRRLAFPECMIEVEIVASIGSGAARAASM